MPMAFNATLIKIRCLKKKYKRNEIALSARIKNLSDGEMNKKKIIHPAQFPKLLYTQSILCSSFPFNHILLALYVVKISTIHPPLLPSYAHHKPPPDPVPPGRHPRLFQIFSQAGTSF